MFLKHVFGHKKYTLMHPNLQIFFINKLVIMNIKK